MGRRNIGLVILLAGSLALGVLLGWSSYQLFLKNVPENQLSVMAKTVAPAQFIGAGLVDGLVIFVWSLLAVVFSRGFRSRPAGGAGASSGRP